ncbi:glycosyltransferase family 1 protein [Calocera viscosa TUFC12733]|uniref:Glycosyltransferase family 1 protein n=1 Tax=Calocera viscosa (strain TUFC12733) TaxID=1330018 RepID=A0A167PPM3_CALVF|nr:glycosyltransferase family 1 protein [Calocera viscosa TUFC12733]
MSSHWVIFTYFPWGHLRPESNLTVSLARRFPDIIISCIVDADFASKSLAEMKRNTALAHDETVLTRIRLIPLGRAHARLATEGTAQHAAFDPRVVSATSPADEGKLRVAFDAMMAERPFEDDEGKTWEPIRKPNLMISDLLTGAICPTLKETYGLPLYLWWTADGHGCRTYGPREKGGRAPGYLEECEAIEADPDMSMGRSFQEIAQHVWARSTETKDDIIRIKGLPPIYQWEDLPQKTWFPGVYDLVASGYPLLQLSDGVLLPTLVEVEKEGLEGVMDWYHGKVLCAGPQLPAECFCSRGSNPHMAAIEVQFQYPGLFKLPNRQKDMDPCIGFLDEALEHYDMHSAIYICFGSLFFPNARHVQILLRRILALEKPMPFILAAAAPTAIMSEEFVKEIQESGRGLIVTWAPQQAILAHPALAAIVSHCGGGGTFESLSQGVPVIGWPFVWDQPPHALWMSEVLDTGFELLQVRDGPVRGKAYRGAPNGTEIIGTDAAIAEEMDRVLRDLLSEEGKRKRANAIKVKQLIWEAHLPGGQVEQHLGALKKFVTGIN